MAKNLRSVQDLMAAELPAAAPVEAPSEVRPAPAPSPAPRPEPTRSGDERLSVIIPAAVIEEMKIRAAKERTTLRVIVLRALRAIGLEVPATDLVDRRAEANARRR